MAGQTSPVQSVTKAMILLDCLADARRPMALSELAACTGWAKSTVHGLLGAMRETGMVEQENGTGRYRLGVHLFELGSIVGSRWDARERIRPYLQRISIAAGESASLAVNENDSALVLDCVDTGSALRVVTDVGTHLPLHASALGKALLAALPEREAEASLRRTGLAAYTPHTVTELPALRAELAGIRARGCALENGEMRVGMRALAVAVRVGRPGQVYAVGLTGMFRRVNDETFLHAESLLLETAEALRRELGSAAEREETRA